MKIFLLLLLTLLPLKTKAWTIYDKNDDKLNLKIEYRFYKDVKEGKYFYWNDLDENYPYSDLDNYYYDEVCKWNNKCEDNGVDLVIKKKVNKYKKINPVKYIKIITWDKEFDLNKFKVFSNSKEIKYTYDNSISLGIIEPSSEAILTLDNSYELESLNFKSINQVNYRIELTDKLELSYAPIIEKIIYGYLDYSLEKKDIRNRRYSSKIYLEDEIMNFDFTGFEGMQDVCGIRKKYVYYYKINREYQDGYYEDLDGYTKDPSLYQISYQIKENSFIEKVYIDRPYYITNYITKKVPFYETIIKEKTNIETISKEKYIYPKKNNLIIYFFLLIIVINFIAILKIKKLAKNG